MKWSLSEQHIAYYSGGVMVGIEWEIRLQHASIRRDVFQDSDGFAGGIVVELDMPTFHCTIADRRRI
jgi:hypothetical protein